MLVLEKHADFLRDFRGDTLHPSTLEVMHELGLLKKLLERPHNEVIHLEGVFGDQRVSVADFSHLPTVCKFIALMPQWDFLDFLAEEGKTLPAFSLRLETEVTDLLTEGNTIAGVRAESPDGPIDVRADLVIGADGRHSIVRERAGLEVVDFDVPIDVLWMRISRHESDPDFSLGQVERRPPAGDARAWRLLAVCPADPEGRLRRAEGSRARRFPGGIVQGATVSVRTGSTN